MSRRSRKQVESDGDRSHIPREERSYVEYHPALLTHLSLHLVRQADASNKRAYSLSQGQHVSTTNNHSPASSHQGNLNGSSREVPGQQTNGDHTPTLSQASNELSDVPNGDGFAFRRQLMPHLLDTSHDLLQDDPTNLYESAIDPTLIDHDVPTLQHVDSIAIDPALLNDVDEIAAPSGSTAVIPFDSTLARRVRASFSSQTSVPAVPTPRNGSTRGSIAVAPSDRFLRSEVSVEEKFERLRREEGFSIGKLHEPTFRKLDSSVFDHKVRLTSNAIAFGYQADRPYDHPDKAYLRAIDIPESQLVDRVEYDMDEQDDYWLGVYNDRRQIRDEDPVSREVFEITMTKVEKEWTALERMMPKPERKDDIESEDAKCAICDDGECENTNAIVFCDGCNLAVHQDCYGVPYIPEGQWLCRKCFASPMDPVQCLFCPSTTGAFKQTSDLHWAHLLCTNWIPEVVVGNPVFMEPIEGVSNIPVSRWKLVCYICKLRVGACIQCSNKNCYTPFHVSCARRAKLFLQHNPSNTFAAGKAFCDKHVPDWYREEVDIKSAFEEAQNYYYATADSDGQHLISSAQNTGRFTISLKRSKQSAVIPAVVFAEIMNYMQKFRIRNKADFIADMCKYWSLKRRARRGQSLLKRLQLQIDDIAANKTEEEHKLNKLQFTKILLHELEDYHRPLLEDMMVREETKKERCELRDAVIELIFLPLQPVLIDAIKTLQALDTQKLLHTTCDRVLHFPEGSDLRMTWARLLDKTANAQYLSVAMFETDLTSMINNILETFPETSSREHRLVKRLQEKIPSILNICHGKERARALNPQNMTATCFDEDFEPNGLVIREAPPWNWANRDASPLSDLDDVEIDKLERAGSPDSLMLESMSDLAPRISPVTRRNRTVKAGMRMSGASASAAQTPTSHGTKCKGCQQTHCDGSTKRCNKFGRVSASASGIASVQSTPHTRSGSSTPMQRTANLKTQDRTQSSASTPTSIVTQRRSARSSVPLSVEVLEKSIVTPSKLLLAQTRETDLDGTRSSRRSARASGKRGVDDADDSFNGDTSEQPGEVLDGSSTPTLKRLRRHK